jgi:hypothetical protein
MSGDAGRSEPRHRRFTLADGMILVAASAIGIALIRVSQASVPIFDSNPAIEYLYASAWVPCLWTASMVLVGVRGPCPGRRRLARSPGWMACLGASFGAMTLAVVNWAFYGLSRIAGGPSMWFLDLGNWVWLTTRALWAGPGLMVAATWMTLAVGGRWRPERVWTERVGIALGAYWILLLIAHPVVQVFATF